MHQKQIIESYKLEAGIKGKAKVDVVVECAADTGGASSSGPGGLGGAPPPAAAACTALPSLLTSYFNRLVNKQLWKLKGEGNIACAPMGIEGFLGNGKPVVSPWGRLEDDPVEVVDSAAASEPLEDSTKYEDINTVEPWAFWDQVALNYHSPPECATNCAAAAAGGDAPAVPLLRDADGDVVPALACWSFGVSLHGGG